MIFNWSQDLTILTNGGFVPEELGNLDTFAKNGVEINHKTIESISGDDGQVKEIKFNDGTTLPVDIIYMRPPSKVNGEDILKSLDVEFDPIFNLIKADQFQKTNIPGLYAAGECTTFMRTLSCCVAQGTLAGTFVSKELFAENWNK